jgi:hypothetical protein
MDRFDKYSVDLLEEAKRFLELAKKKEGTAGEKAYLHAALLISISSLEAFVNGIADDFKDSDAFNQYEKAFLAERELIFEKGKFKVTNRLKMTRLIERIEFLFHKFKPNSLAKDVEWWSKLKEGILLRNAIVHPKEFSDIQYKDVEFTTKAVISCINQLFLTIYKRSFPGISSGLESKLNF